MEVCPDPLGDMALRALDPAVRRDGHDWKRLIEKLLEGHAQVWSIGGVGYVYTYSPDDEHIDVILAGGERAAECVGPWEAAMLAHPAHQGRTIRIEGRKGWRRLLPHWEYRDGVLYMKVAG